MATTKADVTGGTPESWRGVIDDLLRQRGEVEARLAELEREKRPQLLPARTGDVAARTRVDELNTKIAAAQIEAGDIDGAMAEARRELEQAEAVEAAGRERKRLTRVSALAERRVEQAALVEERTRALAEALAGYDGIGLEIRGVLKPGEDAKARAVVGAGRLTLTLAHHLGTWIDQPGRMDRRGAEPFADRERQALHGLLLSDRGIAHVARDAA